MSIRLITFSGQTVTPKTDGIIQDASIGQNGIFYGCEVTASGNSLHIDGGYGLIKGRYFEIDATTIPVTLATSDTLLGRLYVKLDLSNTEAPIQILTATGETLPSLEQDADANFDDGVWEMELATFNITTTEISDLTETYQTITDNASLINALQTAIDTLNSNVETIHVLVGAGATKSYAFSAFGESRYYRILIVSHGTVSNLRGIYLLDSYNNVAVPILSASNLTVTVSGQSVTIKNTASTGTAGGIII